MRAVNLIRDERPVMGVGGRSQGAAAVVLTLIGGLAILALLYGLADHQISSRRSEVAALRAQAQAVEQRVAQLSPYTSFAQLRDERVQDVSDLIQTRFDWASALRELGRVLPAGASITSLDGSIAAPSEVPVSVTPTTTTGPAGAIAAPVTSATPAGSTPTFAITGCAQTQAQVANTLYRMRLMAGVDGVQLESSARAKASEGGSSSQCGAGAASFTATVSFDALPAASPAASSAAASPGASSSGSSAPASAHSENGAVAGAKAAVANNPGAVSGGSE